ncbi:MAG: hypothetical protein H9Q66_01110 [Spiroplasma ixodetis]|nr:hypothetical protein [Spiroplasma ixodetis]
MDKKVHVWIDNELKERAQKYCKENDISLSQLTRKLLREFLKNDKK